MLDDMGDYESWSQYIQDRHDPPPPLVEDDDSDSDDEDDSPWPADLILPQMSIGSDSLRLPTAVELNPRITARGTYAAYESKCRNCSYEIRIGNPIKRQGPFWVHLKCPRRSDYSPEKKSWDDNDDDDDNNDDDDKPRPDTKAIAMKLNALMAATGYLGRIQVVNQSSYTSVRTAVDLSLIHI